MRFLKCTQLKKRFVSCVLCLLTFSVSLLPAFIDKAEASTAVSDLGEYVCDIYPFFAGTNDIGWESFSVPCDDKIGLYATNFSATSTTPFFGFYFTSTIFKSASYDRTVIFTISPVIYSGLGDVDYSWNGGSTADVKWKTDTTDANSIYTLSNGVSVYGTFRDETNVGHRSAPYTFYVTVPATANYFEFDARNTNTWSIIVDSGTVTYNVDCFGAYVLNTADRDIISLVQRILAQVETSTEKLINIEETLVNVVNQLIALKADTSIIISMLTELEYLSNRQLTELIRIANNTDAIYALLTEALVEETEQFDESTQQLADDVHSSANEEARWQANMQGSYEELNIANTNFGGLNGSIVFVMRLFEDMLDTFGSWSIVFTFPLTIGIALLVIGRISKAGGGNSSRNSEHKGGEGGA